MKKRFNIKPIQLFALIVLVLASFSCKDKVFDVQNGETITPDQHYKSIIDAEVTLGGVFAPLQNVMPKLILIDGLRSDQMTTSDNAEPFLKDINNQILSFDNPYLDASDYYKVIVNANEALANIAKDSLTDRNFNKVYLKNTKGALVTIKCWTYLNLVRLYGQAALISDNLATVPNNLTQLMLSKNDMIDTCINQLLPYIPTAKELATLDEFEFNDYPNNKAVLGELYLEKGDYVNAALYLKLACESFKNLAYKVSNYPNEGWRSLFGGGASLVGYITFNPSNDELISLMPFNQNEGQFNPLAKVFLPTDQFTVRPTQLLVDSFLTQIPSKGVPGDIYRGLGTPASGPASIDTTSTRVFFINKYSINKAEPASAPIIMSRAADLHLMLAEALNRIGGADNEKTALILMNSGFKNELKKPAGYTTWSKNLGVRGRVYLKSKIVPDSVFSAPGDLKKSPLTGLARTQYVEDLIMNERSLELAFEGKRWFDLLRVANRRRLEDPNSTYLADKVAAKFTDPGEKEAVRQRLLIPTNWYLPLTRPVIK